MLCSCFLATLRDDLRHLTSQKKRKELLTQTRNAGTPHLYALLILPPYLPALRFIFICLLLRVRRALRGGRVGLGDGGAEVALEPGVEAGVVLVLEWCARLGHAVCHLGDVAPRGSCELEK